MSTSFNLIIWMNGYVMFGHLYSNSELGSRFARILKMAPCKFMRTVAIPLPPPGPSCTSCWGSQDLWQFCSVLAGVGPANGGGSPDLLLQICWLLCFASFSRSVVAVRASTSEANGEFSFLRRFAFHPPFPHTLASIYPAAVVVVVFYMPWNFGLTAIPKGDIYKCCINRK